MIKFTKLYRVKTPQRGTALSAGIDFFIPDQTPEYIKLLQMKNPHCGLHGDKIVVRPHDRILIPSGIKVLIPENTALIAFNRSSVASKLGLDVGASVVDYGYTGEVHLSLTNTTDDKVFLEFGQKIIQFLLTPIMLDSLEEIVTEEELYKHAVLDTRGSNGFGSTDQKV